MQQQLLIPEGSKPPQLGSNNCPITRYNYFLHIYQLPGNKIPEVYLQPMLPSSLYTFCFTKFKRHIFKVLVLLLLLVPVVNTLIPILAWWCLVIYFLRCGVFEENKSKTVDPFANMVYDPNICQKLGKDHYFFEVELRELKGFTFNYNDRLQDQLNLRKERGKVKFMVYNGEFWTHYYGFDRYKKHHCLFAISTTLLAVGANLLWFILVF